jgi:hypothetical protein
VSRVPEEGFDPAALDSIFSKAAATMSNGKSQLSIVANKEFIARLFAGRNYLGP